MPVLLEHVYILWAQVASQQDQICAEFFLRFWKLHSLLYIINNPISA